MNGSYKLFAILTIKSLLTDVTSSGMENTIKNENVQAVSTDIVTNGCCLGIFPYLNRDTDDNINAKHIAKPNK